MRWRSFCFTCTAVLAVSAPAFSAPPAPTPKTAPAAAPAPASSSSVSASDESKLGEPYADLPILTWQEEMELHSLVRQVLFNTYLPFLARPTRYRGVHNDSIPNQTPDFDYQRPDVRGELLQHQRDVDVESRGRAALTDAEINKLIGKKVAFRPEQLKQLLTQGPRFDDLDVVVTRAQPLGGDIVRVDFELKTAIGGVVHSKTFGAVDLIKNGNTFLVPMRVVLDVAQPPAISAGGKIDPLALINDFIEVTVGVFKSFLH
jgi:hypothetical protein